MFLTLVLGAIVIVAGFSFSHADYVAVVGSAVSDAVRDAPAPSGRLMPIGLASVLLFSSFIGFDAIAQAGGEARDPGRTMPRAITLAVVCVGAFYLLFTAAVYHAVPWQFVAAQATTRDVTAPGLLAPLLPRPWQVLMTAGAAVALIKDLPAMLLAVSRLMFAWAEDGIFPAAVQSVHPRWRTPHVAILCSTAMATLSIIGSHLAGDFFLGVDILVTSMLVNFLVMCLAVLALPRHNPALASAVRVFTNRPAQVVVASAGALILAAFLVVQTWRDLTAPAAAWYFRSTPVWALVTAVASVIYWRERQALSRRVPDLRAHFIELPRQ
jgi:amino acid transporter